MLQKSFTGLVAVCALTAAASILAACGSESSQRAFNPAITGASHLGARYDLIPLPTLGGKNGFAYGINDRGRVVGDANLPNSKVSHATTWVGGKVRDLGTLGGRQSAINWPVKADNGEVAGVSQIARKDPLREKFCPDLGANQICVAFRWKDGTMTALPTLGGNNAEATGMNDRGDAIGVAENSTRDKSCVAPQRLDFYGVVWQRNGRTITLSPLSGDTASGAVAINKSGMIVGASGSCGSPFGSSAWMAHAVLWKSGSSSGTNLGNLGGTVFNAATAVNDRGEVAGVSSLPGSAAYHAFEWHDGTMTDLGTLSGDLSSAAFGMNNKGQIVGQSCNASSTCRGFIWEHGAMTDLNMLLPPRSHFNITYGGDINDNGAIVGYGNDTKSGRSPAFVLLPDSAMAVPSRAFAP
jgi:probable HAF family extracellular repeat protein